MNTTFPYIVEQIKVLEDRLNNELNAIVAQLSTEEIPLVQITNKVQTGRFEPEGFSKYPVISLVADSVKPDYSKRSYSGYEATFDADICVTIKQTGSDARLAFYQLANYVKAVIILINKYGGQYELSEEGIEFYESLAADAGKRWAAISVRINFETITN